MTTHKLKIGILETGRLPPELMPIYDSYPSMFIDWLAPLNANFEHFAVLDDIFPPAPDVCDLWVITGSRFGAYEDLSWIPPLEQFIRDCREAGQKMIGICFGHQIIAQALGGAVEKSDKGWGLGVHQYAPVDWPEEFGPPPGKIQLQAIHQDQVTVVPTGAKTIAQSDFCENAAVWYPGFALTVQGHPEVSGRYAQDLINLRRGSTIPDANAERALEMVNSPTTRQELAWLIRDHVANI